jgi:hypothetical protein
MYIQAAGIMAKSDVIANSVAQASGLSDAQSMSFNWCCCYLPQFVSDGGGNN